MTTLERMDKDDGFLVGCLETLYALQTSDEQIAGTASYRNNKGFNSNDAVILTSFVQQYRRKQSLSPKQLDFLRRSLKKYVGQLEGKIIDPLPLVRFGTVHPIVLRAPTLNAEMEGNRIRLSFTYNPDLVEKCKLIDGHHFEAKDKSWDFPLCTETVDSLKLHGFNLSAPLLAWYVEMKAPVVLNTNLVIPGLKGELRQFQKESVAFIEAKKGRALVALDMGLGKTFVSLAWLQIHPELRPALIICPASLKLNWEREARKWTTEDRITVLSGRLDATKFKKIKASLTGFIIVNYDILANTTEKDEFGIKHPVKDTGWKDFLKKLEIKAVVVDECHAVKSRGTSRTKAVQELCKSIPHVIGLSGTPIENRPIEIYNSIRIINPFVFPSHFMFAKQYCGAKHNGYGWDFSGHSNLVELNSKLCQTVMIRRLKKDVLKELPPKVRSIVPMEITNMEEYLSARDDFLQWLEVSMPERLESSGRVEAMAKIEYLRQICIRGKLAEAMDWISNFLDSGEKLVAFGVHRFVLQTLMEKFGKEAVLIDGSVTGANRQLAVDRFMEDDSVRLLCGNIRAAGQGLNLQVASNTAFLELPWTPGALVQAEDRIWRIGQTAQSINIWYLVGNNTIDEDMATMLEGKAKVLGSVLDGVEEDDTTLVGDLIRKLKAKESK